MTPEKNGYRIVLLTYDDSGAEVGKTEAVLTCLTEVNAVRGVVDGLVMAHMHGRSLATASAMER